MENSIFSWIEIPVSNMDRAINFYETVFGWKLTKNDLGVLQMALFPLASGDKSGSSGALVLHPEFYKPSSDGTLVYIGSPSGDLVNELAKVLAAGGQVLIHKKPISPEFGFMGMFLDTEGNRVAMHSLG